MTRAGCIAVIGPDGKVSYRPLGEAVEAAFNPALHPRDDYGRFMHDPGLSVIAGHDSLAAHTGPDGRLDPQRQALHERILAGILGGHKRQAHPRALFLGGGPASGKTTVMRDPPGDAAQIACDDIKALLPEYKAMVAVGDLKAGEYVQEESKKLKEQAIADAAAAGINILLDSTGDTSYALMASEIGKAHQRGYTVAGKYVTVDADEAVRRSMERATVTGRMVPEATIREMHAAVSEIFARLVKEDLYDEAELWDNNVPGGQAARLVGRKRPGGHWEVLDPGLWERFLAKAGGGARGQGRGGHRTAAGSDPGQRLPGRGAGHRGEQGPVRDRPGPGGGDGRAGDRARDPGLSAAFNPAEPRDWHGRWHKGTASPFRPVNVEPITAKEARGDSRPVSAQEFQELAAMGLDRLRGLREYEPPRGLDQHWDEIKQRGWDEVQKPWGGATIDPDTGIFMEGPDLSGCYALSVKPKGMDSVTVPEDCTRAQFDAAMDEAKRRFRPELGKTNRKLGLFHDDEEHRIDIDVSLIVYSEHDVDTIGAYTHAVGGAYEFDTGNGHFPPHVAEEKPAAAAPGKAVRFKGIGQWHTQAERDQPGLSAAQQAEIDGE